MYAPFTELEKHVCSKEDEVCIVALVLWKDDYYKEGKFAVTSTWYSSAGGEW